MELGRTVKSGAKEALRHFWGKSVVALLICYAVYLLIYLMDAVFTVVFAEPDIVSLVRGETSFGERFASYAELYSLVDTAPGALFITGCAALAYLLILPPLFLGYKSWYYHSIGGESDNLLQLFSYFSSFRLYFRAFFYSIGLLIRKVFWLAFFSLPGAGLIGVLAYYAYYLDVLTDHTSQVLAGAGICFGCFLLLAGWLMLAVFFQRYALAPYYLAEGKGPHAAFRNSVAATSGNVAKLFLFKLSFFGWWVLCLLVLPVLYANPYQNTAVAIYAKYLIQKEATGIAPFEPEAEVSEPEPEPEPFEKADAAPDVPED
ncbi:MAG TPA: DUF975 family protein [Oscillospiraceae bacterium]|nr:DUF975 family protein [Oscillospiraceae bacterium]